MKYSSRIKHIKITGSKTSPFVLLRQVCHRPAEWWRRRRWCGGGGWRKSSQNQQLPHQGLHSHLWGHRLSHRLQEAAAFQEAEPQAEVKVTRKDPDLRPYKTLLSRQIRNCYCCRCVGLPLHRLKCFLLGCSEFFMMCCRFLKFLFALISLENTAGQVTSPTDKCTRPQGPPQPFLTGVVKLVYFGNNVLTEP